MKNSALVLLGAAWLLSLNACTLKKDRSPSGALNVAPRFEELTSEVPTEFADAKKWNQSATCPEGAVLTPFTRYQYEPEQNKRGFKHYYGRSCAIIQVNAAEVDGRKPASLDPADTQGTQSSVSVLPHGPFMWWYENGKKMETGSFDHGTLTTSVSRYEPDGTIATKD